MTRRVLLGPQAQKAFTRLSPAEQARVRKALQALATDPFKSRPGADIKRLKGTRGRQDLHRLRIGERRAIYAVEDKEILVTDLFQRRRGYET